MRPLPPRSTTSDTSTVASDLGWRPSAGLPLAPDASPDAATRSPSPQPIPQQLTVQQPPKAASPIDIAGSVATGGRSDSLRAASGERRPPGLLSASFAAENKCAFSLSFVPLFHLSGSTTCPTRSCPAA